jgi:hypothetical protein
MVFVARVAASRVRATVAPIWILIDSSELAPMLSPIGCGSAIARICASCAVLKCRTIRPPAVMNFGVVPRRRTACDPFRPITVADCSSRGTAPCTPRPASRPERRSAPRRPRCAEAGLRRVRAARRLRPRGGQGANLRSCGRRCRRGADRRTEAAARHLHGRAWRGKDSNLRRQSQRVYSASPLTAREPRRGVRQFREDGARRGARRG